MLLPTFCWSMATQLDDITVMGVFDNLRIIIKDGKVYPTNRVGPLMLKTS